MQTLWYVTRDTVTVTTQPGPHGRYIGTVELSEKELDLFAEMVAEEKALAEAVARPR